LKSVFWGGCVKLWALCKKAGAKKKDKGKENQRQKKLGRLGFRQGKPAKNEGKMKGSSKAIKQKKTGKKKIKRNPGKHH